MPGGAPLGGPPTLSGLGAGGGGGLGQTVFRLKSQVKSLAAAIPQAAEEIGQIDQLLDAVMLKSIPGGGASPRSSDMMSRPSDPALGI
jgi:hypothetical protein